MIVAREKIEKDEICDFCNKKLIKNKEYVYHITGLSGAQEIACKSYYCNECEEKNDEEERKFRKKYFDTFGIN